MACPHPVTPRRHFDGYAAWRCPTCGPQEPYDLRSLYRSPRPFAARLVDLPAYR